LSCTQLFAQKIPTDTLSRVGYAYSQDDTSKLVFIEHSKYLIKDNEIVWSSSKFTVDGKVVATKLYRFDNGDVKYVYQFKDGYNETAIKNGPVYDCYVTEKHGDLPSKKSIKNSSLLRIDEGVISTILKHKKTLDSGERIPIKIMVVERGDYYEFLLELVTIHNSNTTTYTLFPNNFLLRAFVPDFYFTLQNGQLKKVIGMSKVGRQLDEPEVLIKFK
jgi:hypothetical protein